MCSIDTTIKRKRKPSRDSSSDSSDEEIETESMYELLFHISNVLTNKKIFSKCQT